VARRRAVTGIGLAYTRSPSVRRAGSALEVGAARPAFGRVLEPVHQLAPDRVAGGVLALHRPPAEVAEADALLPDDPQE